MILEEQIKALPEYDKFPTILNDLYTALEQKDYYINKCRSNTIKRALAYSQFGMWEEVNAELNDSLKKLYDIEKEVTVDLKYSNEYDQQLWEELHPEGIINVGDLDRIKFFSQNNGNRTHGAFKAEFQKWMVLGKNQPAYQVFEGNREKLCMEWTSLPKFIDQVHYHKLARFQENVELNEIMALLHNCRGQPQEKALKDFYTASAIQRDRVPVKCESNKIWRDVLENRYIPLSILNASNETRRKSQNDSNAARGNKFAFKRLLNYIWVSHLIFNIYRIKS